MHSRRGFALLLAIGVVAAIGVAALLTLGYVAQTAETQGDARRHRLAFFAAQAGLADAKERMRTLMGTQSNYTSVMSGPLGGPYAGADDPAPAGERWYEVFAQTPYRLTRVSIAGPTAALDDTLTESDREVVDSAGVAFSDFPAQTNVTYRVFLRDDADGDGDSQADTNNRVWLIAVGQVTGPRGRPAQAVVQALITNANAVVSESSGTSQRMSHLATTESTLPSGGVRDLN